MTWAVGKRVEPAGRAKAADPDGTSVTIATYDNRPELPEVAQVLQQQLRRAGFKVKLEIREYSRLESDALAGTFDAFVGARNSLLDTGDPVSVLIGDFTCDGSYNLALLCDKKVDRAVAAAEKESDTAKRLQAAMNAEAAILGTDATVPLVHQQIITGVAGFGAGRDPRPLRAHTGRNGDPALIRALWRALLAATLLCGIGLLPWLSRTDPALTVLKARLAERDPTPDVLAAVRDELGLDSRPVETAGGVVRRAGAR